MVRMGRGGAIVGCMAAVLSLAAAPGTCRAELKDGTYEAEHSFVAVAVTIRKGRIADIRMTRHGGGGEKYAAMVEPMLARMVEKGSTDVDTVTGATVSGNHLKAAVEKALKKAAPGP